ncbi:hypothetical protein [Microbaculum marinum]|uniref:Uncharacterized protein n=1 Tax=Microbaculum marinum TaxID=1764581 RepID=A0AAW9RUP9_9HYPH
MKKPKFDALAALRQIAANPETPATARVQACKALMAHERASDGKPDAVTARALRLLKGGKAS